MLGDALEHLGEQSLRVRDGDGYRVSGEGLAGAHEGTRPDDDPLTRSLTASAREAGRADGRAEGLAECRGLGFVEVRAEGCRGGRLAERLEAVRAVLRSWGSETGADPAEETELLSARSLETLLVAALT